jgi:hypothetical protein
MEMEARTGEFKVERTKAQSAQELQHLLDTTTSGAAGTAAQMTSLARTEASQRTRNGTHSRVERAATRDPVGDGRPTEGSRVSRTCPFADAVDIAPRWFLESGVARVECPLCHAVRQVPVRSAALRFPKHDARRTRTAQTGQRGARQGTTWEVVGE